MADADDERPTPSGRRCPNCQAPFDEQNVICTAHCSLEEALKRYVDQWWNSVGKVHFRDSWSAWASAHRELIRARVSAARWKNGCEICGESRPLVVHHLAYNNWGGREEPDEIAVLCRYHHVKVHATLGEAWAIKELEDWGNPPRLSPT